MRVRRRGRTVGRILVGLLLVIVVAGSLVLAHDGVARLRFNQGWLCQRSDGTHWRDHSNGCAGEDPRCAETACATSALLVEGWRHACVWVFFKADAPPTGPRPYNEAPSPGQGCSGRA